MENRATHHKITDTSAVSDSWNNCDIRNHGWPKYSLVNPAVQTRTFPELHKFVIVITGSGDMWRTIFTSEIERHHVMVKWKVQKWQYGR